MSVRIRPPNTLYSKCNPNARVHIDVPMQQKTLHTLNVNDAHSIYCHAPLSSLIFATHLIAPSGAWPSYTRTSYIVIARVI